MGPIRCGPRARIAAEFWGPRFARGAERSAKSRFGEGARFAETAGGAERPIRKLSNRAKSQPCGQQGLLPGMLLGPKGP